MSTVQLIIIALVQGITEFLPISSSGHLILISKVTDFPDQGLLIDVAVHVATLAAIMVYFARDVGALAKGGVAVFGIGNAPEEKRRVLYLILATIPAVLVGGAFAALSVTDHLRSSTLVGATLVFYGILLFVADRKGEQVKTFEDMGLKDALIVGAAQALALIPGTSRSGVTMTAARFLGFKRDEAARFSFLLGIPAIAGAGFLTALDLVNAPPELRNDAMIAGVMTFIVALGAMAFLMRWLRKASMTIFVVYRVALGLALLGWGFWG